MDELLRRGEEGAQALAKEMEWQSKRTVADYEKLEKKLTSAYEKTTSKFVDKRMDRKSWSEVEELRKKVLSYSRSPSLTKEQVKKECDPAVARLEELLAITAADVLEAEADLQEMVDKADELSDLAWVLWDWWNDSISLLSLTPSGQRTASRLKKPNSLDGRLGALQERMAEFARLATPMPERDRKVFAKNDELREELDPEEFEGNRILNLLRVRLGLPALWSELKLTEACRVHSKDMVQHGFFAHSSPVPGRESPWKRAAQAGTSAGAENIAAGQSTGRGAIRAWWYSPGHHRNMLANHGRVALGRYQSHWTQMFGG